MTKEEALNKAEDLLRITYDALDGKRASWEPREFIANALINSHNAAIIQAEGVIDETVVVLLGLAVMEPPQVAADFDKLVNGLRDIGEAVASLRVEPTAAEIKQALTDAYGPAKDIKPIAESR